MFVEVIVPQAEEKSTLKPKIFQVELDKVTEGADVMELRRGDWIIKGEVIEETKLEQQDWDKGDPVLVFD